ncbi:MAG: substrate-binding domain-containing protein [Phycisphaeraceae bacterium]|nr:substrate-binding domain-containing protein [Phycisphaeraceae bacterium]
MPGPMNSPEPGRTASPARVALRRVLVAFDPGRWRFRGALRGINRFAAGHGEWDLMIVRYSRALWPLSGAAYDVDGMFIDAAPDSLELAGRLGVPCVTLSAHAALEAIPTVGHDDEAIGRLAFETLEGRGLRRFGLFTTGETHRLDVHRFSSAFQRHVEQAGRALEVFVIGPRTQQRGHWLLDDQIADLADWLRARAHPLGLLAIDDEHAWRAAEAARLAGLNVPGDVCILGVGDDDCLCESCQPTLSSIALDYEQFGFEAARLLHTLLTHDQQPTPRPVPPLGVIERASTDMLAIEDRLVSDALAIIRDHAERPPDIDDLAVRLHTSRRTLYRRFVAALGYTPGEALRRTRLEAARRLIVGTDLKLVTVADRVGFPSISQLSRDIQREYGARPSVLRRRAQRHHPAK